MTTTSLMLVGILLQITAANQATATRVTHVLRGRLQYEHDRRRSPSQTTSLRSVVIEKTRARFSYDHHFGLPEPPTTWFGQG